MMFENEIIWQQGGAKKRNYRAFLLRCWKEADIPASENGEWRITLVQIGEEEHRRGFACLDDLFTYLQVELERD